MLTESYNKILAFLPFDPRKATVEMINDLRRKSLVMRRLVEDRLTI